MADKPVTREEKYLAYLTGDYKGEIPKPITRREKYLYELCLKGIGGEISPEEIKSAVNEYLEKNPVKPGATTEQAQQIEQNKKDVASLKEDMTSKADKTSLAQTDRKLDALWKLNQGISYEFQTDDTEAYQKTVPSGAKLASVEKIGGKTIVWNQLCGECIEKSGTVSGVDYYIGKYISFNGTIEKQFSISSTLNEAIHMLSTHKYLSVVGDTGAALLIDLFNEDFSENIGLNTNTIFTPSKSLECRTIRFMYGNSQIGKTVSYNGHIQLFDLTQMFGSGNEPSTPEEFEAMFPSDYYPYNAGELMSAPVNEVTYSDTKTQETSYPIPQAILNLPGYGWSAGDVRNEVNWENKKYHKRVGKVDLGTLEYRYDPNTIRFIAKLADVSIKDKNDKFNCISTFYTATSGDIFDDSNETDLIIRVDENVNQIYIRNLSYADATTFKNAMSGVILYYELAEEQITDISNLIGDTSQEPIEVEAGGSLTFKNSNGDNYRIPVPSSEEYLISLAEVAK